MHVYVNSSELAKYFPILIVVLVGICIVMWLLVVFLKNKDNSQPMKTVKVKILEKPIQQGNIEWYVVECEDGSRLKLRSFQSNHLIITVGDVGIISFKGKTIQSFQREG
ncbi:MAG: hypothetical protein NC293_03950 [Roseburia sp.]|nr:hypothetical protein [Roseburia sp.]